MNEYEKYQPKTKATKREVLGEVSHEVLGEVLHEVLGEVLHEVLHEVLKHITNWKQDT